MGAHLKLGTGDLTLHQERWAEKYSGFPQTSKTECIATISNG